MSLNKEQRDDLVHRIEQMKLDLNAPANRDRYSIEQGRAMVTSIDALRSQYDNGLPATTIGRCPHCKEPLVARLDLFGLDGPFWNFTGGSPVIGACEHFLTFLGALHYRGHVPTSGESGFYNEIHSGPEAPYVVPRLMGLQGMRAVLLSLPVATGKHTAFLTSYFTDPPADPSAGHQVWLRRAFYYRRDGGTIGDSRNDSWDFDLDPWLAKKPPALFWIAPDDPDLTLHEGAADCPFLAVEGRRHSIVCRRGDMRVEPAPDDSPLDLFD